MQEEEKTVEVIDTKEESTEINTTVETTEKVEVPTVVSSEINILPLEESTKNVLERIIQEDDVEQVKDLTKSFNLNQFKKNMMRVVKYGDLLDKVLTQTDKRITERPDEIPNKELLDFLQAIQTNMEKTQKAVDSIDSAPLIQINNQDNSVNVNLNKDGLDKDSKENVLSVVQQILKLAQQKPVKTVIVEPQTVEIEPEEKTDMVKPINPDDEREE